MINNKVYDALKICAIVIVPIATFISALLVIWNIPYAEQITATLAALEALLGGIVTALKSYYDKKTKAKSKK